MSKSTFEQRQCKKLAVSSSREDINQCLTYDCGLGLWVLQFVVNFPWICTYLLRSFMLVIDYISRSMI